jgi:hypothetical protein
LPAASAWWPGDVVHLDAQVVADAVREEGMRVALGEGLLRRNAQQAQLRQHARDARVGLQVHLEVRPSRRRGAHEVLLHGVDRLDELHERGVAAFGGNRARDVAGVAAHLRAGVEQQHLAAPRAPLRLVVQRGGLLVERDDRSVRQRALGRAGRLAERLVDLELRGAGAKAARAARCPRTPLVVASSSERTSYASL